MKKSISFLAIAAAAISFVCADEAAQLRENLKNMPRPWAKENYSAIGTAAESYEGRTNLAKGNKLDWSMFESSLQYWAKQFDYCSLDVLGKTLENDPIYCMKITNNAIPSDKKFKILIVAHHGGGERSALHSTMAALEFLVSDEAKKYRDNYEIRVIPCGNIFGYFRSETPQNSKGIDPYAGGRGNHWDIKNLVPKKPENTPEIVTFCKVLDEMKPELLLDFHGVGRLYPGIIMTQYIGGAGSNHVLKPWATDLINYVRDMAGKSGTPCYDLDEEIQRLVAVNDARKAFPQRFRDSGDYFYTDLYPYLKYHTLPLIFEISHEQMAVEGLRGVLEYGMNAPANLDGSFPVDNILTDWGGFMVQAWGTTPGEKRASRVELWNKIEEMQTFAVAPPVSYRIFRVVTFGSNGEKEFIGNLKPTWSYDTKTTGIFKNRPDTETVKWSVIDQFIKLGPEGRVGKVYANFNVKEAKCPQNGISMAFDIQIAKEYDVDLLDIRLNGITLKKDSRDGYQLIKHNRGHRLIVNVPPEKSAKTAMYIVSAAYNSNAPLKWGWESPKNIPVTKRDMARVNYPELFTEAFDNRTPHAIHGDYNNGKSAWGFFSDKKAKLVAAKNGKGAGVYATPVTAWCGDRFAWEGDKNHSVSFDFKVADNGGFIHKIGQRTKPYAMTWGVQNGRVYAETIENGAVKKVLTDIEIKNDVWYNAEVIFEAENFKLVITDAAGKKFETANFMRNKSDFISAMTFMPVNKNGNLNVIIDNVKSK
ncbi:MAG: hypothetical protein IKD09_03385 [Lentisphaeria bacterium]|nr:hypothetical protein [Lentisphaeria bacterium]